MRARNLWLIGLCAALLTVAGIVWAQNPHFVGKVTATLSDGDVLVCFKEAGLGNDVSINYEASADAKATYRCVNPSGNCIDGHETVSGPVSTTGTFVSGQNGSISQCLTLSPPPPPAENFCPGGADMVLSKIEYSNITITDETNHISEKASPSSLSATVFNCPKGKQ